MKLVRQSFKKQMIGIINCEKGGKPIRVLFVTHEDQNNYLFGLICSVSIPYGICLSTYT